MPGGAIFGKNGKRKFFYQEDFAQAQSEGWSPESDTVVRDAGDQITVPADELESYVQSRPEAEVTPTTEAQAAHAEHIKGKTYGGAAGTLAASGAGLARGLTLSGSDYLLQAMGVDPEALQSLREVNPAASLVGEIGGAVAPALLSGGASTAVSGGRLAAGLARTPAGLATRLGEGIAARGAARGFGGRVLARGAGAGAEGALFGAAEGSTELALSDEPIDAERAVSVLGTNALFGAGLGAGVGVGATAAGAGLKGIGGGMRRAKKALDDFRARQSKEGGSALVDEVASYHRKRGDSGAFLVAKGEQKAVLAKQAKMLRDDLDAPKTLADNPKTVLRKLEKEEKVLRELIDEGEEATLAKLSASDQEVATKLRSKLAEKPNAKSLRLTKDLASEYRDVRGYSGRGGMKVKREDAEDFLRALDAGDLHAKRVDAYRQLPEILEQNVELADDIRVATAPQKEGITEGAMKHAAAGYAMGALMGVMPGGFLGSAAAFAAPRVAQKLGDVAKGIGSGTAAATSRTATALDRFAGVAKKAGRPAKTAAVPTAVKTLQRVAFAPQTERTAVERAAAPAATQLHEAYEKRAEEIRSQTRRAPDGSWQVTPQARRRMADQLEPIRIMSPLLADRMETIAARQLSFLASRLPRRPDYEAMRIGPDNWRPSNMRMREWARYVAAVSDPGAVEERLVDGSVTPEDADAYRTVYPERLAELQQMLAERMPEMRGKLSYKRRLALSILTGRAADPAFDPRVLRILQGQFAREEGTESGTRPKKATPTMGSISKEALPGPTRAQARQQTT